MLLANAIARQRMAGSKESVRSIARNQRQHGGLSGESTPPRERPLEQPSPLPPCVLACASHSEHL